MSADPELESFAEALEKRLAAASKDAPEAHVLDPDHVLPALDDLGAVDLAVDTLGLENSLVWLSTVLRTCARFSPSIAFALAGRYAGQRANPESDSTVSAFAEGDSSDPWQSTVPALFAPSSVVMVNRRLASARLISWDALEEEPGVERTGLSTAKLCTIAERVPTSPSEDLSVDRAAVAMRELDVLNASVGLGLIQNACLTSEDYAANRRQFGRPIATFAGLRAILVEIRLRYSTVEGLLSAALEGNADSSELAAVTGRAGVDACLDAVQVHGGYGYIEEYPIAGLLRDAISLRARGGGRRSAVAAVAAAHLPSA
jgi:Acyl-CoA dehydrogenase, C-terminal domain